MIPVLAVLVAQADNPDELTDSFGNATDFVIGFLIVGVVAAVVAARLAKRSRDPWRDDECDD